MFWVDFFARPDHQGSCREKVKGRLVPVEWIHGGTDEQPLQQSAQPAWWFLCSSRPWSGGCRCCCCCCLTQIILQVVLGERIPSWSVDLWLGRTAKPSRGHAGQFWLQMRSVRSKEKTTDTNLLNLWGEVERLLDGAADTAYLDTCQGKSKAMSRSNALRFL